MSLTTGVKFQRQDILKPIKNKKKTDIWGFKDFTINSTIKLQKKNNENVVQYQTTEYNTTECTGLKDNVQFTVFVLYSCVL